MNLTVYFQKKVYRFCLGLATLATIPPIYSQVPDSSVPEALLQKDIAGPYILEALQNNTGILAQEKRYQAARASITSARALPNPRVQITHFVESIQTRTGPQRQGIQLQQPFPAMGTLGRRTDIARTHAEALWHAYAIQQFKLMDEVVEAVFDLAYIEKSIEITHKNIDLLQRLESIAEDRVKSGASLTDLLRLQVEIERHFDSVSKQETQRDSTGYRLESLLGRDPTGRPFILDWEAPQPIEINAQRWISYVRENSPEIAMLRSIESSQEARERLAKLANRPELSVGLNYLRTGDALNPATSGSGDDPWAIMVGVSLPVWGKANNAIGIATSLEKDAVSAQILNQERGLIGNGMSWIAKLEDSQKRIQRFETKLIPLVRQVQEITESSYQSGNASALDLIDSDRALLQQEIEYWRAAANAWIARWKLATLSGGLWLN
jgi:outer membrane protein TolC